MVRLQGWLSGSLKTFCSYRLDLQTRDEEIARENQKTFNQHQIEIVQGQQAKAEAELEKEKEILKAKAKAALVQQGQKDQIEQNILQKNAESLRRLDEEKEAIEIDQNISQLHKQYDLNAKRTNAMKNQGFEVQIGQSRRQGEREHRFLTHKATAGINGH